MGQHRAPETREVPIVTPIVIEGPVTVIEDPLPPVPRRRAQAPREGAGAWSKTITAATFSIASLLATVNQDPSGAALIQLLSQVLSVFLVAVADNRPPGSRYVKLLIASASAVLSVLSPVLLEGGWSGAYTQTTLTNAALAVAAAVAVWWVPNTNADGVNVLKVPVPATTATRTV